MTPVRVLRAQRGDTPLMAAIVKLCSVGDDMNSPPTMSGGEPLAFYYGRIEGNTQQGLAVVACLLRHGANVHARSPRVRARDM